jgi:hypothetical protein
MTAAMWSKVILPGTPLNSDNLISVSGLPVIEKLSGEHILAGVAYGTLRMARILKGLSGGLLLPLVTSA